MVTKSRLPAPTLADPFLTKGQVAEILGVTERAIERYVSAGDIPPPLRIGKRLVRWRLSMIDGIRTSRRPRSA